MKLEDSTTAFPCPGCGKEIEIKYRDIYTTRKAQCHKCRSEYRFESGTASRVRDRIRGLERASDDLRTALATAISKAEVLVKR